MEVTYEVELLYGPERVPDREPIPTEADIEAALYEAFAEVARFPSIKSIRVTGQ